MDQDNNEIDCDLVERDRGFCVCDSGPTLSILNDVRRAYEERMELISRTGGSMKLQMQVDLLQAWVSDLTQQNTLLCRTVEELETEIIAKLVYEQRSLSETVCELRTETAVLRRRLARKDSDLRGLLEVLRRLREFDYCTIDGIHFNEVTKSDIFGSELWQQTRHDQGDANPGQKDRTETMCDAAKELKLLSEKLEKDNLVKEREIRRLKKEVQEHEQTILKLNVEGCRNSNQIEISKMDAGVTADLCCGAMQNRSEEPEPDYTALLRRDTVLYQERIQHLEDNLKSRCESVVALRAATVWLKEELRALRWVCGALERQLHDSAKNLHFRDMIILEMRCQLRRAKAKLTGSLDLGAKSPERRRTCSYEALTISCVRPQPRRKRRSLDSCKCRQPYDGSEDDNMSSK